MTTVIFIHGTGVRTSQYRATFEQIQKALQPNHSKRSDLNVVPCLWGETFGTKLNAKGASIPLYDTTLAIGDSEQEDPEIVLWEQLYRDSLYELRLLSLKPANRNSSPFVEGPGDVLRSRVNNLGITPQLQAKLQEAGIAEVLNEARRTIVNSRPYNIALANASEPLGEYCDAIARAIIAETMLCCEQQDEYPPILTNAELRDEIVELLSRALGDSELGLGGWVWNQLSRMALSVVTDQIGRKRGAIITNPASFIPCDILLYQGRGEQIRTFIRESIQQAQPPVVLLAHSLGGIACVDLLVLETHPQVALLVTVGTQAPFLYEINALQSLSYGKPLPQHFPPWLNIYDLRDYLSFIGANVFPNRIQDVLVDNNQPFPRSHSAYWTAKSTWNAIIPRLP